MGSAAAVVAAGRCGLAPVADGMVLAAGRVVLTAGRMVPEAEVTTASGVAWPRGGAAACAGPNSASLVA